MPPRSASRRYEPRIVIQERLEREYERLGPQYVRRAIVLQGHLLYPVVFFGVWFASAYVSMSLGQYFELALLGCGLQVAYTLVSDQVVKRLIVPVERWHEAPDDQQSAIDAWGAAAALPLAFVRRSFSRSLLGLSLWLLYAIWVAVFVWQLKLEVLTGLLVYAGVVVLVMYAVALRYFGAERIVRPSSVTWRLTRPVTWSGRRAVSPCVRGCSSRCPRST